MSWYNPLTWYVDSDNLAAGNAAYEQSAKLNAQKQAEIAATQGQAAADAYGAAVAANSVGQIVTEEDLTRDLNEAFYHGWHDALNERKGQLNDLFGGLLGAVPASVWLIAAVVLFFWLGGPLWLKNKLR